jgi:hypothetical protein
MKYIMKIRLRPDGTWENVYDELENALDELVKLSYMATDYLEQAVQASGYKDAKLVIDHIRGLK